MGLKGEHKDPHRRPIWGSERHIGAKTSPIGVLYRDMGPSCPRPSPTRLSPAPAA